MSLLRQLGNVVVSALAGFTMVTVAAAVLEFDSARSGGGLEQLGPAFHLVIAYVLVLPLVGWLVLRLARQPLSWAVAFLGPVVLLFVLRLLGTPSGGHGAPWIYGLCGGLAYAVTAAAVLGAATGLTVRKGARR